MKHLFIPMLLASVALVSLALAGACDDTESVDETIQCVDLCDELDSCFETGFSQSECIDSCEDEPDQVIDTCDDCLDENERECTSCEFECELFTRAGTSATAY